MEKSSDTIMRILEANRETLKRFRVLSLGLFGSVARGDATERSDLDFLVELEKKSFDVYMDLKEFLEELFSCNVDLVMKDALKARLKEPILKETIYAQGL
jgi:uncharacterized protein